jgi:hypothetical protein
VLLDIVFVSATSVKTGPIESRRTDTPIFAFARNARLVDNRRVMMFLEEKKEGESPTRLEPWRQALLDAAQFLKDNGWCQKTFRTDAGQHCVIGALTMTDRGYEIGKDAERVLYSVVGNIIEWNDREGQTAENVIETLRYLARVFDA